jgi:macrolide-specific efflux system membrane fusion protein
MNQTHADPSSSGSAGRRWHSRPSFRHAAGLLVLAALAGAGWFGWHKLQAGKNVREQYVLATVQRGDIEDLVSATGTVQPRDYVDVGAQVSGQLKKIHVEVGSVVSTGDLLAEIDATVLSANVDARRASLRNLQATMKDREAQLALAQLQFQRQKNLMAEDATTAEALQQAEAALRSARAQLEALKAQIDQTDSSLRADEANLDYTRIYAPMSGTVVSITARQGQTINANQSAPIIMRIADLSTMTVQTQVSEADVGKLRQGMDVYFTTLGSQGRRWSGQLRKVEPTPTVTNNVVLYNALFDVPNVNRSLMTQMTAQVFFIAARAQDTLLIPASALQGGGGRGDRPRRERSAEAAPAAATAAASAAVPVAAAQRSASGPRGAMRERREARGEGPGRREAPQQREAAAPTPGAAASDATASGLPPAGQPIHRPRRATVKVIDADGNIEERQIETGVTNRVQVQVLSGLAEGDQVIAGLRPPPSQGSSQRQSQQGGLQQGPMGMPPGGAGGGRGR